MDQLKQKFFEKSSALKAEIKSLLKEHGGTKVDEVTLKQVFGGMRGVKSMIWETSQLDPIKGIRFRGYSIPELRDILPRVPEGKEPLPEGLFWLMLVGEVPTAEEVQWLTDEWEKRSEIPQHTMDALDALPKDTHPMSQFSIAIVSLQTESVFAKKYSEGMSKTDYWDATYEDTMNLIAKLPRVAAYIYRRTYHDGNHIEPDHSLDWGAHTTHLVGSTLSDAYMSFAGGMNSLAGPLHGLANQEVIKWIFKMIDKLGTRTPSKDQIREYVKNTLAARQVIPGYGHAVLREPDPRFVEQKRFAKENISDSEIIEVVWKCFEVVPEELIALGKVKNPWPNVDAHSGAILVHYGMNEYSFYTVLFGVSRALGVLAALCWSRALGFPLERPKSVTSKWVKEFLASQKAEAAS